MKDLGRTYNAMYPTHEDKDTKHYPRVSLPKEVFGDKKLSLDDVHHFQIKAKIVGHSPESKEVHLEMLEGEAMDNPTEEKKEEGDTVLGKA